jgi:lysophospholipase L1-like esterase
LTLGLALGLASFEIAVRLFLPVSDFFWQWDPVTGLKLVPHKQGRYVKRGLFDVPVTVNSAGFRDRDHSLERTSGTRRIVVVGDSFVEALQVRFEQSITSLLESRLQASGVHAETINLGVSGTGTARQYLAVREYGLRYKPDLVLLFFVGNDVSDNSRRLQGRSYVPYPEVTANGELARDPAGHPLFTPFADQTSRLEFIIASLRQHSKGYRLVREAIDGSTALHAILYRLKLMSTPTETINTPSAHNFGFYEIYRPEQQPAWAEAWRLTEEMLLATRDLAQSNNAAFEVVLVPAAWEVDHTLWKEILSQIPAMSEARLDPERPSRQLTSFLRSHNVSVVNLLPDFLAQAESSPPLYLPGDAHWTAEGHRLAADLLAEPVTAILNSKQGGMRDDSVTASRSVTK